MKVPLEMPCLLTKASLTLFRLGDQIFPKTFKLLLKSFNLKKKTE